MNNIAVYPPTIHGLERVKRSARIFITIVLASFTYLLCRSSRVMRRSLNQQLHAIVQDSRPGIHHDFYTF